MTGNTDNELHFLLSNLQSNLLLFLFFNSHNFSIFEEHFPPSNLFSTQTPILQQQIQTHPNP